MLGANNYTTTTTTINSTKNVLVVAMGILALGNCI
jgi:hypothetical protein